jgi:hypothetical protein
MYQIWYILTRSYCALSYEEKLYPQSPCIVEISQSNRAILGGMNWLDRRIDMLAATKTKREMRNSLIIFGILSLLAITTVLEGPTNPRFPENHVLYSTKFWLACLAAPICFLNVVLFSTVFRRILRRESNPIQ